MFTDREAWLLGLAAFLGLVLLSLIRDRWLKELEEELEEEIRLGGL
jgi:uncharacterized membrane protein